MRVSVVAVAALAAVSFSASRCHADSTLLPGTDGSVQSPGLAADLPGSDLCDLQPSLTRPSSAEALQHDPMQSGAMLRVLKDPSLLAAAPGTPARAAMMTAPLCRSGGAGEPVTASPGSAGADEGVTSPDGSAVAAALSHRPLTGGRRSGSLCVVPSLAPGALMSSGRGERAPDGIQPLAGLLCRREDRSNQPGLNTPAATLQAGATGLLSQDGGLYSSRLAANNLGSSGGPGIEQAAAPGSEDSGRRGGAMLLPGAFMGLAATPHEKQGSASHGYYPYALAGFLLVAVPFAAGLLRRRLI
jgi:hypothetical protein